MDLNNQIITEGEAVIEQGSAYINWLIFFGILFGLMLIARLIIKYYSIRDKDNNKVIFLVRLPKEKPNEENKDVSVQQLHEEIATGETIFSSIGGLRAQRGFMAWLYGRDDNFSFEIVANKGKISFYISAPKNKSLYIEQQIHAYYPEASIEVVDDYNAFNPQGSVLAGYLKARRSFIFPFLDYTDMNSY